MFFPLPWERLLWHSRRRLAGTHYALTDFRLVVVERGRVRELVLHDIGEVQRVRSLTDRAFGTSTLHVANRRDDGSPLVLSGVRSGAQLAALLELLASDPNARLDAASVRAALAWKPRAGGGRPRDAVAGIALVLVAVFVVAIGLQGDATPVPVLYPSDDAIRPGGKKRQREAIVDFMETTVMPWARQALGPVVGRAEDVTCFTCHGADAGRRDWRMPAVAALPEPLVRMRGLELHQGRIDAQVRNAIYGYIADHEKIARAGYMREMVMPGMARLLRRPSYDFTRSYEYNRRRHAFGCYHCHKVN